MIPYAISKEKENTEKNNAQDKEINKLKEKTTDSGWKNLSPLNGCTTYSSSEDFQRIQYKKVGNEVILRGMFKKTITNTDMAQLPSGYRPNKKLYFTCISSDTFCEITINPEGKIISPIANGSWLNLEGIRFFID